MIDTDQGSVSAPQVLVRLLSEVNAAYLTPRDMLAAMVRMAEMIAELDAKVTALSGERIAGDVKPATQCGRFGEMGR